MDDTDLGILRWMYPGGSWTPWGVDPRISTAEIARHTGLSRKTVWKRVQQWKREGIWKGWFVSPNLAIFGAKYLRAEIQVADPAEGWILFDELESVDGVLRASLGFGDSASARDSECVLVGLVGDTPAAVDRRIRSLRRLSPQGIVNGPYVAEPPDCSRTLTPLDWRLLAAIIQNPTASLSKVAHLVDVTLKTAVHRHSALLDGHVMFYHPDIEWTRHPSVALAVFYRDLRDLDRIHATIAARFPQRLPISIGGLGYLNPETSASPSLWVRVPAHSPNEIQALVLELSRIPGVRLVRPDVWGPSREYPRWVEQHLAERLATPAGIGARRNPRSTSTPAPHGDPSPAIARGKGVS